MKNRAWLIALNVILLLQAGGVYFFSRKEAAPALAPLRDMPAEIGSWRASEDIAMDMESLRVLKPDDYLMRNYRSDDGITANLYIAYFRTQRTDRAPHSPQNCLPGNGWVSNVRDVISLSAPAGRDLSVNRFVVARGEEKSVVLYWYETPTRPVWSELSGRLQLMIDSLLYNRSDTALVRVILPIDMEGDERAERAAVKFAEEAQPLIRRQVGMWQMGEI